MKFRTSTLCVALLLGATLSACAATGPELPPEASMTMDMGAFNATSKADKTGDHSHHNAAALRVGVLNTRIALALLVPRLVFAAAISQRATFEDDRWVWTFDAKHLGKPINATLTGRFEGNSQDGQTMELEMRVTCAHCKVPTDNFLWYTGTFVVGERKGHWQFFDPEIKQDDKTFVRIDWEVTDDTHKTLTFTNKRTDGHEDANDVIAYARDGSKLSVKVRDESETLDYEAEADIDTGSGWIQVPVYNKGVKGCWDDKQHNVDCAN